MPRLNLKGLWWKIPLLIVGLLLLLNGLGTIREARGDDVDESIELILAEIVDIVCEAKVIADSDLSHVDSQREIMRIQLRERELVREYGRDVVQSASLIIAAESADRDVCSDR